MLTHGKEIHRQTTGHSERITLSSDSKCSCKRCGEHIAFPSEAAGQTVTCPHCGLETKLFIPPPVSEPPLQLAPPLLAVPRKKKGLGIIGILGICFSCVILGSLGLLLFSVLIPKTWEKSNTVQRGDIKITINATRVNASVNPSGNLMKGDLNIIVNIENLNSTKIVKYEGWSSVGKVFLSDNLGNIYNEDRDLFTPPPISEYPLYPNKKINDFLSFLKPVENIQWLHLELPAKNFGGSGMVRFEIPASEITIQRW